MNNKNQLLKRVYLVASFLLVAALLITGCDGAITFQGSAEQNEGGGIDITGGVLPESEGQTAGGTGMDQTTLIYIIVGVAVFILILVMLVTRGQSKS